MSSAAALHPHDSACACRRCRQLRKPTVSAVYLDHAAADEHADRSRDVYGRHLDVRVYTRKMEVGGVAFLLYVVVTQPLTLPKGGK